MNSVNKTLYIPLRGKAYVSKKGLFLDDKKAEKIWEAEGFALRGKSSSKWLAYYMGIRSAVFDEWLKEQARENDGAVVIHIGCGLDSRIIRAGIEYHKWYDVDFSDVIEERKLYYSESCSYQMLVGDARDCKWLEDIEETGSAIVVMEGVSMYLTADEMQKLTDSLCDHFERVALLVDCYTSFAARVSKHRNPINEVGVTKVYGVDDPKEYQGEKIVFVRERKMIPEKYVNELKGFERFIFSRLYAGSFSEKLYRLFEYKKG